MIKRKDGSYSKRGLWDNIRANKGSGKEPTKEMLKQESKIKKEENMNSMYKKGGKAPKKKMMNKESFLEESKEMEFGAPGTKPPMKKKMMGGMYKKGGFPDLNGDGKTTFADVLKGRGVGKKMMGGKYEMGGPGDGTTTRKNLLGQTVTENRSGLDYDKTVTRKNGTVARQSGVKTDAFNPETGTSDTNNFYSKKFDRAGNLKSSSASREKYIQEDKNSKGEYDGNSVPYVSSAKANRNGKVTRENGYKTVDNPSRLTINESSSSSKRDLKEKAKQSRASFKTGGSMFETMLDKLKVKGKKK